MNIEKFLIQYKTTSDEKKAEFIKKHITTKYLPYENKVSLCQEILDRSMWIEVNGKEVFNINTPAQYMLLIEALIQTYMDIDMPEDGKKRLEIFNIFEENSITPYLIEALGGEYSALNTVLKMMIDDVIFNNTNLTAYIDQKIDAMNLSMDAMMDGLSAIMENQSKDENVIQFPQKDVD